VVAGASCAYDRRHAPSPDGSPGVTPLLVADAISYEVVRYLGDAFDFALMFDLTGRSVAEVMAVASTHLVVPGLLAGSRCSSPPSRSCGSSIGDRWTTSTRGRLAARGVALVLAFGADRLLRGRDGERRQ
jgi:hypothetical protein